MAGTTYNEIDNCEHVLSDLRGGCSGCNYDIESIVGHLEAEVQRLRAALTQAYDDIDAFAEQAGIKMRVARTALQPEEKG